MPERAAVSSVSNRALAASRSPVQQVNCFCTVGEPRSFYARHGKRVFDMVASFLGMLLCAPVLVVVAVLVRLDSPGPVFFRQIRVGQHGKPFVIVKFRSMVDSVGQTGRGITPENDRRVTAIGAFLRKWKLDELPQLWNVFVGDMSLIGPRPELPGYVAGYSDQQKSVLRVKPGISDYASLRYRNEGRLLQQNSDPERYYRETILPDKLSLNLRYLNDLSLACDLSLLLSTIRSVLKAGNKKDAPRR